jgi:hypothetical protein
LSTDVAELSDETEDRVVLLVEGALTNLFAFPVGSVILDSGGVEQLF